MRGASPTVTPPRHRDRLDDRAGDRAVAPVSPDRRRPRPLPGPCVFPDLSYF
ncbi:hypothetical protein AZA_20672 [Nitrospirillum viridazoti Y2]|nr:hypothetical protein AZA_20672 [Nitrospirillum amazonense Y2]